MKLVILGATGHVGSETVDQALKAGHEVVAYARRPEVLAARPGLTIVGGSITDVPVMAAAFAGADAVISAVGSTEAGFARKTLPAITAAVSQAGVRRFVLVSAFGVGDTRQKASGFARLIYATVVKKLFVDKELAEAAVLPTLDLDCTVVYPVNLKAGPSVGAAVVPLERVESVPGLPTLPYIDVAEALVRTAEDEARVGQRLLITTNDGYRGI
ncbi:NAD(P)-dependent oxidoreductase [Agromyces sp. NPDC056965]|uniref:NAD(P)-dependent oxidoreductase n=1 Tax=Agromyces sp. NPDC056965 TaxID=3345983 RepID=UPI003644E2B0